jgi:hypothetical protein
VTSSQCELIETFAKPPLCISNDLVNYLVFHSLLLDKLTGGYETSALIYFSKSHVLSSVVVFLSLGWVFVPKFKELLTRSQVFLLVGGCFIL